MKKPTTYNDNNLAICYYRFSSSGQDTSIEQQREAAERYAEGHDLKIIKEYEDAGISGTTSKRPGFQLMLSEIKSMKPGALIIWKTDRLARDRYDIAIAKKTIRDAGTKIHYIAETTPDDSPEARLMEGFMDSMAAYYSEQLSVNVRRGQDYNASRGLYLGINILGYKVTGEGRHNKRYVIDEDTAPLVQRIFHMYADEGKSASAIAKILNAEGRRTVRGGKFTPNNLRRVLTQRSYLGEYKFREYFIEDGMPVIIDQELFDRAQKKLKENKRFGAQRARGLDEDGAPRFWLTGKLYCGHCKETMQGTSGRSKTGQKYYYYSCKGAHNGRGIYGNGCKKKSVRKEKLEEIVVKCLTDFLQDPENLASLAVDVADYYERTHEDTGYLKGLEHEFKETSKALDNVLTAIMAGAAGEAINDKLQELETRKKGLADSIEAEKAKRAVIKDKHSIREYFEKFAKSDLSVPEDRDLVFDYFVDKVYVYDDRLVFVGLPDWHDQHGGTIEYLLDAIEKKHAKSSGACALGAGDAQRANPWTLVGAGGYAIVYGLR